MSDYLDPPLSVGDADDEVSRLLLQQNFTVRPARLNPQPYSKIVGKVLAPFHGARISYRVEDGGSCLNMIYYERLGPVRSLRNSFLGFEKFLDWLVLNPCGVTRLQGAIHELNTPGERTLTTGRISRFYKRILCGKTLKWVDGQEIIYTEMQQWRTFRELDLKTQRTSPDADTAAQSAEPSRHACSGWY